MYGGDGQMLMSEMYGGDVWRRWTEIDVNEIEQSHSANARHVACAALSLSLSLSLSFSLVAARASPWRRF